MAVLFTFSPLLDATLERRFRRSPVRTKSSGRSARNPPQAVASRIRRWQAELSSSWWRAMCAEAGQPVLKRYEPNPRPDCGNVKLFLGPVAGKGPRMHGRQLGSLVDRLFGDGARQHRVFPHQQCPGGNIVTQGQFQRIGARGQTRRRSTASATLRRRPFLPATCADGGFRSRSRSASPATSSPADRDRRHAAVPDVTCNSRRRGYRQRPRASVGSRYFQGRVAGRTCTQIERDDRRVDQVCAIPLLKIDRLHKWRILPCPQKGQAGHRPAPISQGFRAVLRCRRFSGT